MKSRLIPVFSRDGGFPVCQPQVIAILDNLQEQHHISYALLWRRRLVKIQVTDWWCRSNRPIEANEPCAKNHGFFFFPIQTVHERISLGRCSEMDGYMKFTTTIACSAPTWEPSSTFVTIASDVQQIPGGRRVHRHDRDECSRARQSRHDGFKHPCYGAAHPSSDCM